MNPGGALRVQMNPARLGAKSYELRRPSWGKQRGPPQEGALGLLGVPIGTVSRVLPYITPTWGPLHSVWSGPVRNVLRRFAKN